MTVDSRQIPCRAEWAPLVFEGLVEAQSAWPPPASWALVTQKGTTNRVCSIIPIHPPKFKHLRTFLVAWHQYETATDVAAVFSSQRDAREFATNIANGYFSPGFRALEFNPPSKSWTPSKTKGNPVFYKKWWGVSVLGNEYDYFLIIDSETKFVRSFDVLGFCRGYFAKSKRIFFGLRTADGIEQSLGSMWRFPPSDHQRLRQITKDGALYFWYNEVPVVEAASARRFIAAMVPGGPKPAAEGPEHASTEFDWLTYAYWLLLHESFTLVDLKEAIEANESATSLKLPTITSYSLGECGGGSRGLVQFMKPHWAAGWAWRSGRNRMKFNGTDIFMTFHLDRERMTKYCKGAAT